jgi:hypothetical protein
MDNKTPEVTRNVYGHFKEKHINYKSLNNKMLTIVIIPTIAYMLFKMEFLIIIAFFFLAFVLIFSYIRNRNLFQEYTKIEKERLEQIKVYLTSCGIVWTDGRMTFGYRSNFNSFSPVFLYMAQGTLYVFDNIFIKNFIYNVGNQIVYLFDIDEKVFANGYKAYETGDLNWKPYSESHQQLLRTKGLNLNQFLVVEGFIYDCILSEMITGKVKRPLNTTYQLTRMKNEKVYVAELDDEYTLFVAQEAMSRLIPDMAKRNRRRS